MGFTLLQLQSELVVRWSLPKLLITLMDVNRANQQRVRNVILAVNLARHSANGWDDATLPDDYEDIGRLLHMQVHEVMALISTEKQNKDEENKICADLL